ncbi:MAG TPA: flagellar basal body rod protein FlgC [Bryobacteraceae bacterium]|nr:flagellar basal body rod protein FlgC [Bryobacteraceae bacterium]
MSLFSVLSVSASGMSAQRTRAELLAENLANAETTRTPDGGPYKRKDAVFSSASQTSPFSAIFQTEMGSGVNGVEVADVVEDTREPDKRYLPGHPDADRDGYVAFPRINPAEDMVDLLGAARGYQGNVAAMTAIKDMILHSIDLMK